MIDKLAKKSRKLIIFSIVAITFSGMAASAMAQSAQGDAAQGTMNQNAEAVGYDQPTLEKFAAAASELNLIRSDYAQKLQGIQDQEKAMEIQKNMGQEMVKAVQAEGLDVQKYNEIANKMANDLQLKNKVEAMMKK